HGEGGRAADVEPVDLPDAGRGDGDGQGGAPDVGDQRRALAGRESLAVADAADRLGPGGKGNGRGHHWTSQGTAANLIHPDQQGTPRPGRLLPEERRAGGGTQRQLSPAGRSPASRESG